MIAKAFGEPNLTDPPAARMTVCKMAVGELRWLSEGVAPTPPIWRLRVHFPEPSYLADVFLVRG